MSICATSGTFSSFGDKVSDGDHSRACDAFLCDSSFPCPPDQKLAKYLWLRIAAQRDLLVSLCFMRAPSLPQRMVFG